ncbi:hypothetical protein ZWY2020_002704 [Hordeum vulgare]|nr:hypothetical protein ZWY2020_002704 [Hordeum vulgare]
MDTASTATAEEEVTRLEDLPESCLAHVLALTSPRDACRCATVSPSFREAAESDAVWDRFLPPDYRAILLRCCSGRTPPLSSKKDAYLWLSNGAVRVDEGDTAVWLAKESGAKCVALSARKLSLPWDDGEFSWRWTPHPRSRFAEVAQLVHCTGLEIYGRLPAAALTPRTDYAAYLVFDVADEGHRSRLSGPGDHSGSWRSCGVAPRRVPSPRRR